MNKLINYILVVSFFVTSILPPTPLNLFAEQQLATPFPGLSATLGSIEEEYLGDPKKPSVLFLQDAHTSLEAQENMSRIIQEWVKKGVTTIFTEGNKGEVDARGLFQGADPKAIQMVSEKLLREVQFGATEAAHAVSEKPFQLIGLEDLDAYEADLEAYKKSRQTSGDLASLLNLLNKAFQDIAPKMLKDEKLKLWQLRNRYEEGKVPLEDYLKYLVKSFNPNGGSAGLNLRYKNLNIVFSLFQTPLNKKELKKKVESLKSEALFKELDLFASKSLEEKANSNTLRFLKLSRQLELLGKLSRLELSSEEWHTLSQGTVPSEQVFWSFLSQHGTNISRPPYSQQAENYLAPAIRFYELAVLRDQKMFENFELELRNGISAPQIRTANDELRTAYVIVAGGFHRQGITEQLKQAGYSYRVISPRIDHPDSSLEMLYDSRILSVMKAKMPLVYYWQRTPQGWIRSEEKRAASLGSIRDMLEKMGLTQKRQDPDPMDILGLEDTIPKKITRLALRWGLIKNQPDRIDSFRDPIENDPVLQYFESKFKPDQNKRLTEQRIIRFIIELFQQYEDTFKLKTERINSNNIQYFVTDYFDQRVKNRYKKPDSLHPLLLPEGHETDWRNLEHLVYRYFLNCLYYLLAKDSSIKEYVQGELKLWRMLGETKKKTKWKTADQYRFDLLPIYAQILLLPAENDLDNHERDKEIEKLANANPLMRKAIIYFDQIILTRNDYWRRIKREMPEVQKKLQAFALKLSRSPISILDAERMAALKKILLSGDSFILADIARELNLSESDIPKLKQAIQYLGENRKLKNSPRIPKGQWTTFLEVTNERGEPTGIIKDYYALHQDGGDWHKGSSAILVTPEGEWVVQQRRDGGAWDVSTGGHVELDSNPLDMVRAESMEELEFYLKPDRIFRLRHPVNGNDYFRYVYRSDHPTPHFDSKSGIFYGRTQEGDTSDQAIEYIHFTVLSPQEVQILKKRLPDPNKEPPQKNVPPGTRATPLGTEEVRTVHFYKPEQLFALYDSQRTAPGTSRRKFSHNLEAILAVPEIREGIRLQLDEARRKEASAQSLGQRDELLSQLKMRQEGNQRGFQNIDGNKEKLDWLMGEKKLIADVRRKVMEGNFKDTANLLNNDPQWHQAATRSARGEYFDRAKANEKQVISLFLPESQKIPVEFDIRFDSESDPQEVNVDIIKKNGARVPIVEKNEFVDRGLSKTERINYALRLLKEDAFNISKNGELANRKRHIIKNWWPQTQDGWLLTQGGFGSIRDIYEKKSGEWVRKGKIKKIGKATPVGRVEFMIVDDTLVFTRFDIRQSYRGTYIATGLMMEIIRTVNQEMAEKNKKLNFVEFLYWAPGYENFISHLQTLGVVHKAFTSGRENEKIVTYSLNPSLVADPALEKTLIQYLKALDPKSDFQKSRQLIASETVKLAISLNRTPGDSEYAVGFLAPQINSKGEIDDQRWISLAQDALRPSRYREYEDLKGEKRAILDFLLGRIPLPADWEVAPDMSSITVTDRLAFAENNPAYNEPGFLAKDRDSYPKRGNRITYFPLLSRSSKNTQLLGLFWIIGDLTESDRRLFSKTMEGAARALELRNELEYLNAQTRDIENKINTSNPVLVRDLNQKVVQVLEKAQIIVAENRSVIETDTAILNQQMASIGAVANGLREINELSTQMAQIVLTTKNNHYHLQNNVLEDSWEIRRKTLQNLDIYEAILFARDDNELLMILKEAQLNQGIEAFRMFAECAKPLRDYFAKRKLREDMLIPIKSLCEHIPRFTEFGMALLDLKEKKSGEGAHKIQEIYDELVELVKSLNQFTTPVAPESQIPESVVISDLIQEVIASLPDHPDIRFNFVSSSVLPLSVSGYRHSISKTLYAVLKQLGKNSGVTIDVAHSPQENYVRIDVAVPYLQADKKERIDQVLRLQHRVPGDKETTLILDTSDSQTTHYRIYIPISIEAEKNFRYPDLSSSQSNVYRVLEDSIRTRALDIRGKFLQSSPGSVQERLHDAAWEIEKIIQLLDILREEGVLNRIIVMDYENRIAAKFINLIADFDRAPIEIDSRYKQDVLDFSSAALKKYLEESINPVSFQAQARSLGVDLKASLAGAEAGKKVLDLPESLNLIYVLDQVLTQNQKGKLQMTGSTEELFEVVLKALQNPHHQVTFVIPDAALQNNFRRAINELNLSRDVRNRISVLSGSLTTEKDFLRFQSLEGRTAFVGSQDALRQIMTFGEARNKTNWEVFVASDVLEGGSYRELNEENLKLKDAYLFSYAMSELASGKRSEIKIQYPSYMTFLTGKIREWISGFLSAREAAQAA